MQVPERRFRIVAFDWEGAAVADPRADASAARTVIEALLDGGVVVMVVTAGGFAELGRQLAGAMATARKRDLFIAAERGAEVFGFDAEARPTALSRRQATAEEERLLDAAAERVRGELARAGVAVGAAERRAGRRAIDLIPVAAWAAPPRAAIADLVAAVEARLGRGGLGLRAVVERARGAAAEAGLADARVVTDGKYLEIALADAGDALRWMLRELAGKGGVAVENILVGGDAFGPLAGAPGPDAAMLLPELAGATFVSVGAEPGGAPAGVIHLGGGPERFRRLLGEQVARLRRAAVAPAPRPLVEAPAERRWILVEEGFQIAREHEVESLFTVANGYLGTRGALSEGSPLSAPATFVAGVYEVTPGEGPSLAVTPDWTRVRAAVDGEALALGAGEALAHRRVLDLARGMLLRTFRHRDGAGRVTRLEELRLASLDERHLLLQSQLYTPENYGGRLVIELPRVDGAASPIALATATRVPGGACDDPADAERCTVEVALGGSYRVDRLVAVDATEEAARARLRDRTPDAVIAAHVEAWRRRWSLAAIEVVGDEAAERALRFAAYHLVSAANPDDDGRASVGARALTGPAYRGHVFWDTDVFMLPFFIYTHPPSARALLGYRYRTLPAARERARGLGLRGALYPWESADRGDDVTPPAAVSASGEVLPVYSGLEEHHISADVAYAAWHYFEATGDDDFLVEEGAEMLVETARFWVSRGRIEADGRFHLRGVMGPDEYHPGVDDNAYTNGMARWNLERAAAAVRLLDERRPERRRALAARIGLGEGEPAEWLRAAAAMKLEADPATRLIEQFAGYFAREEIDLALLEPRTVAVDALIGLDRLARSQVLKQADVVMLLHLLWERFPVEVSAANFRYYEPRTAHGSSLSPGIHAATAARLGDLATARRYFRQTAEIDLADNMGNAAGGVHAGALGSLWQAAILGFAGMSLRDDGLAFTPHLPAEWRALGFAVCWRGRVLRVTLDGEATELALEGEAPMVVAVAGAAPVEIAPGGRVVVRR